MTDPNLDKRALRAAAKTARAAAKAAAPEAGARLAEQFLSHVPLPGGSLAHEFLVGGYWPIGDEIDVLPLMAALHGRGLPLALPAVEGPGLPLRFKAWRPGDEMAPGAHGISAPLAGAAIVQPSLLLVPLLAFDAQGWRLGYGAGYYDRTLEAYAAAGTAVTAVGVAYAAQKVPSVPHDGGDVPLDAVVTERGAEWFDKTEER